MDFTSMIRKQLLLAYFLMPVLLIVLAVRWWNVPGPRAPKPPSYASALRFQDSFPPKISVNATTGIVTATGAGIFSCTETVAPTFTTSANTTGYISGQQVTSGGECVYGKD